MLDANNFIRSYEHGLDPSGNEITLDVSLHTAAAKGDIAIMAHLLDAGSDINGRDSGDSTALHRAIITNKPLAVRLLVSRGADPFLKGPPESDGTDGDDAVTCAARWYLVEPMRELIRGGVPIHTGALYYAIEIYFLNYGLPRDSVEMLRLLISEVGRDFAGMPRRVAMEGALPVAAHEWSLAKVRMIMDELRYEDVPDDADKQKTLDSALLSMLNQDGMHDGFQYVEGHKDPNQVLEIVKILVDAGATVDLEDENYPQSLLHFALQLEQLPLGLLEYLVDHGADVNKLNWQGRTPVFGMLVHPDSTQEIIAHFQQAGGKFEVVDMYANTPLHLVRNMDVARWLLASGADTGARNSDGFTPLKKCRIDGNDRLEELLESLGATV